MAILEEEVAGKKLGCRVQEFLIRSYGIICASR
jgi:hypothetical protein